MRRVGDVSSLVCGFDPVKPLVLLPYEGHDDQRKQDQKRHHDDQLEQWLHNSKLTTGWGVGWRALGSSVSTALGQRGTQGVV